MNQHTVKTKRTQESPKKRVYELETLDGKTAFLDRNDVRKYFAQVPHLVWERAEDGTRLSNNAILLYMLILKIAGEYGHCSIGTRKLAKEAEMSLSSISKAKRELVDRGFITIEQVPSGKRQPLDKITINDVWLENFLSKASDAKLAELGLERVKTQDEPGEETISREEQTRDDSSPDDTNTPVIDTDGYLLDTGEYRNKESLKEPIKRTYIVRSIERTAPVSSSLSVEKNQTESQVDDSDVNELITFWESLFPNRPVTRSAELTAQVRRRLKNAYFRENWRSAFEKAAKNEGLCSDPDRAWWNLPHLLKSNRLIEQVLSGTYDWMHNDWIGKKRTEQPDQPQGDFSSKTLQEKLAYYREKGDFTMAFFYEQKIAEMSKTAAVST